jgi:DNA-binding winged helix-turn-helix (wHTH) protein/TolB-like protein
VLFVPPPKSKLVRFGPFEADLRSGELRRDGTGIHLQGQPFHVLAVLLQRAGELVTREELRREVWPSNTFLEFDHALNTAIKKIRIALSDDALSPCYVQTFPKRGYRWIAEVSYLETETPVPPKKTHNIWRAQLRAFAVGGLVALVFATSNQTNPERELLKTVTIAVEPVNNETEDPSLNLLCEGLALHISGRLTQSGASAQVSPAHMPEGTTPASPEPPLQRAGIACSSFSVKTGLRKNLQKLEVEAELIRNSDRASLWHGIFDHEFADSLEVEADLSREISLDILRALKTALPGAPLSEIRVGTLPAPRGPQRQ